MLEIINEAGKVSCDFKSIKDYLDNQLSIYRGMVFTEDAKKDAKATVAELRKQKKDFADRIKEAKIEYMKPYEAFAKEANDILALYDEPINFINNQVDEFETKRIEKKRELIKEIYDQFLDDMKEIITLRKIYNPKWENATFSEKQIKDEMSAIKSKVISELTTIDLMNSEFGEEAKKVFLEAFDMDMAIRYVTEKEAIKKQVLAREEERKREEIERAAIEAERLRVQHEMEVEEARNSVIEALTPDVSGHEDTYQYTIKLTEDAKAKLDMYLDSIGIEYDSMIIF